MKFKNSALVNWAGCLALGWCSTLNGALPPGWQQEQRFEVAAPGLVKFSLPVETLNAARPALEDLRVYDDAGNEVPFLIEQPEPGIPSILSPKSFKVSLHPNSTEILLESGTTQALEGISLQTPSGNFIKSVRVEGSHNGQIWQSLAESQPIFREQSGASHFRVGIKAGNWLWLRLTVDDARTQPIPFTGAHLHAAPPAITALELQPAMIVERHENPGETRLALNLGAANLDIASVQIQTAEPLFTRLVTVAVPAVSENGVKEETIAQGSIYRMALEGRASSTNLSVLVRRRILSRELFLLIRNQDSPPLPVTGVRVERRPVFLVFLARTAGQYHLLTGNRHSLFPRYDLAALQVHLRDVSVAPIQVSTLTANPDFRATEALAGIELGGTELDLREWSFRKTLTVIGGVQQTELDLDVLAHSAEGFNDLRILRGSNQVPYLVQRTSIHREIKPAVSLTNDPKQPKLSRWIIKLPKPNLTLNRLSCETRSSLFQREMTLYEEIFDSRGDKFRRMLGHATWIQTPDRKNREFEVPLQQRLQSDTLILETENGDNPPIELEKFAGFYPATKVLFKATAGDELFLYYGNPRAPAPRYDINLIAGQFLTADKSAATLAGEERLKGSSWRENQAPGKGGLMLWGILALVVVGLLAIIVRLLPKAKPAE